MNIAVVVLNYRTETMTLDCLASLQSEVEALPGTHVFLVDNASNDGSKERLADEIRRRGWQLWITLLDSEENRGFSAGNNLAIRRILAGDAAEAQVPFQALLLLNSDTIVRPGALSKLAESMSRDQHIGLIGPKLEWPDATLQPSCFQNISPLSEFLSAAKTGPVSRLFGSREAPLNGVDGANDRDAIEWISFACVLVRREVFESVGLLDDKYFMYYEDVDYCRRARERGWKIAWEPAARVIHLRGGAVRETFAAQERKRRPRYYYASRARYLAKFYGRGGPCAANLLWWAGRSISLAREVGGRKPPHTAEREPVDIWTGCFRGAPPASDTIPGEKSRQPDNGQHTDHDDAG